MKSKNTNPKLSIFETFKTKQNELTGEALRQRGIIVHLATESNPAGRTRTSIAKKLAGSGGISWKNIYSGIFIDLDEILLPLGIVEEDGRLPLKRGPKALQEKGVPYYKLTPIGVLVSASLDEIPERKKIILQFLKQNVQDSDIKMVITKLLQISPQFAIYLLKKYVKAYCDHKISSLIPFDSVNLKKISDDSLIIQRELIEGIFTLTKTDREKIINFLKDIT